MKIALLNEFSQAAKNPIILNELTTIGNKYGHEVYNVGMSEPLLSEDLPEAYSKDNPRLTYVHLGIQAALLLHSERLIYCDWLRHWTRRINVSKCLSRCDMRVLYRTNRRISFFANQ